MASKGECSELQTTKAIIRALLVAEKRPLTLPQFLCEFKKSEGRELPFKQHGFGDPLSFLLCLPDTVRLTPAADGTEFYVRPTLTKEVQHIQKLVNGQKSKPLVFRPSKPVNGTKRVQQTRNLASCQKKSKPLAPTTSKSVDSLKQVQRSRDLVSSQKISKPLASDPPTISEPASGLRQVQGAQNLVHGQKESEPPVSQMPTKSKSVSSTNRPQPVLREHDVPKRPPNSQPLVVPTKIKDNLCQLLADHLSGIDALQLDEAYARKFGSGINYAAFGYKTIEDFVLGMCGILCATRSSTGLMRVFATFRDCRQPLVLGAVPHHSQTLMPGQRALPSFSVHRALLGQESRTPSTYPCSQQHPKPQPVISVVTSLDTIDFI